MPNYCDYEMHVEGKKKNILTLIDYLSANYEYSKGSRDKDGLFTFETLDMPLCYIEIEDGDKRDVAHHIGGRIFECWYNEEIFDGVDNEDVLTAYISGCCAWSVTSCMFEGGYYSDITTKYGDKSKSITIDQACKELELNVEIFSSEPGMCFAEHYYINSDGKVEVDETTGYSEIFLDQYDGYDDYIKDCQENACRIELTEKEFNDTKDRGKCSFVSCSYITNGEFNFSYVI